MHRIIKEVSEKVLTSTPVKTWNQNFLHSEVQTYTIAIRNLNIIVDSSYKPFMHNKYQVDFPVLRVFSIIKCGDGS